MRDVFFTHLNRLCVFGVTEHLDRRLIHETVRRRLNLNGFRFSLDDRTNQKARSAVIADLDYGVLDSAMAETEDLHMEIGRSDYKWQMSHPRSSSSASSAAPMSSMSGRPGRRRRSSSSRTRCSRLICAIRSGRSSLARLSRCRQ